MLELVIVQVLLVGGVFGTAYFLAEPSLEDPHGVQRGLLRDAAVACSAAVLASWRSWPDAWPLALFIAVIFAVPLGYMVVLLRRRRVEPLAVGFIRGASGFLFYSLALILAFPGPWGVGPGMALLFTMERNPSLGIPLAAFVAILVFTLPRLMRRAPRLAPDATRSRPYRRGMTEARLYLLMFPAIAIGVMTHNEWREGRAYREREAARRLLEERNRLPPGPVLDTSELRRVVPAWSTEGLVYVSHSMAADADSQLYIVEAEFRLGLEDGQVEQRGGVYALDKRGRLRWVVPMTGVRELSTDHRGRLFVRRDDHAAVVVLSTRTGKVLREVGPQTRCTSCVDLPTVGRDGTMYFGIGRYVDALSPSGNPLWRGDLGEPPPRSEADPQDAGEIAVATDGSIIRSASSMIGAFSPRGDLRWRSDGPSWQLRPGANGRVYFVRGDLLMALDSAGAPLWTEPPRETSRMRIAVGNEGSVYVITPSRRYAATTELVSINPAGKEQWRLPISWRALEPNFAPPQLLPDGTIAALVNGRLFGVSADGTVSWMATGRPGREPWESFTVGPDGTIYVVEYPSTIYALRP